MNRLKHLTVIVLSILIIQGCANITPPSGGEKDTQPPVLLSVTPAEAQTHIKPSKIELVFDEYITLSNPSSEVQISPLLSLPLSFSEKYKKVTVRIPDTLLRENTTYRISFGNAIRDLHEGNPFSGYSYRFSTGSYFDSLRLHGILRDAATGKRDSSAVIVLYDAEKSDSVLVREKPLYITRPNEKGEFEFAELPNRSFHIFALKDANNNLMYDGSEEKVAFYDHLVRPNLDSNATENIELFLFQEIDTLTQEVIPQPTNNIASNNRNNKEPELSYNVAIDTSDLRKRTVSITKPVLIEFTRAIDYIDESRIRLTIEDSIENAVPITYELDTSGKKLSLYTDWQENTIYHLRLLKGFAKDTAGTEVMPSKYSFRTKRDEDYARLQINLPSAYLGETFLFVLLRDKDSIYQKPINDTTLQFSKLEPGNYRARIIIDANRNGQWDTGNLLGRKQPERVIPHQGDMILRAGWEHNIDFEPDK
jgi:hypothetical protein